MELWKKGLFVSLFSSMLWEQQGVSAALGLQEHPEWPADAVWSASGVPTPAEQGRLFAPVRTAAATALLASSAVAVAEHKASDPWRRFQPPVPPTVHVDERTDEILTRSEAAGDPYQEIEAELREQAQREAERRALEARKKQLSARGDRAPLARKSEKAAVTSQSAPQLQKQAGLTRTQAGSVVAAALQYQGSPYRYGGTSPQGFDCSGFIQYVMKQAGQDLPRTTFSQINAGVRIAKDSLRPGDLVFFAPGGRATGHVGIYIGNGQFIHADQTRGITISELNSGYWAGVYQAAVRVA